jgi:hypothetical protein
LLFKIGEDRQAHDSLGLSIQGAIVKKGEFEWDDKLKA